MSQTVKSNFATRLFSAVRRAFPRALAPTPPAKHKLSPINRVVAQAGREPPIAD